MRYPRVKADNPELLPMGSAARPAKHDLGVRGFYLGCKQSTGSRQRHHWAHPGRTLGTAYPFRAVRDVICSTIAKNARCVPGVTLPVPPLMVVMCT